MPANKNAVIRYKYLDGFLSDRHHYYDIHELTKMVNDYLCQDGDDPVSRRTIELDLNFLEGAPFYADLRREKILGKNCIHYADPKYSIFSKALSSEEEGLLAEVLNTIGQFDGLNNFEWLDGLKEGLKLKEQSKAIQFSSNPYLRNSNFLGGLFSAITNHVAVELQYHTFPEPKVTKSIVLHPYLLKQYNNRWFLIGAADSDGFMLTFALDRMDGFKELPTMKFKECKVDLFERYENLVGVSNAEQEPESILLWVSDNDYTISYVETKPLHESQIILSGNNDITIRSQWPKYKGGRYVRLNCVINKELKQLIASFSPMIVVLEPQYLRKEFSEMAYLQKCQYE